MKWKNEIYKTNCIISEKKSYLAEIKEDAYCKKLSD